MNEHVQAQQRQDAGSVDLGWWIVSNGGHIDDTVKQTGSTQYSIECSKGRRPPTHRIAVRAMRLGGERPEQKHIMESDDMLKNAPGVPLGAW